MSAAALMMSGGMTTLNNTVNALSKGREERESDSAGTGIQNILGKDDFLKLLITQLRYQDPTKPVEDQDFIAQMAQFSALEQTQNLAIQMERFLAEQQAANRLSRAMSFLGRQVEVRGSEATYTGTVDAVRMVDGVPKLVVGDVLFDVGQVVKILHA